jgi:nitroreductase
MEFMSVLESRHSIKHFTKKKVSEEKLRQVFEAARTAPSWTNGQCWKFVVIDNPEVKDMVIDTVSESNSARHSLEEAPVIVVLCADAQSTGSEDNKDYYLLDAGIAMEHLILAAVNEGLGTCWIEAKGEDKLREILDIPRRYRVIAMTPIGYPGEHSDKRERKPFSEMVYRNEWDNPVEYLQ